MRKLLKKTRNKINASLWSKERTVAKHKSLSVQEREMELKKIYLNKIGTVLNIDAPKRYSEKIQWVKLYGSNKLMSDLADKYLVRNWVAERIGEDYLIPILGVWDKPEDIDFAELPKSFVLKTNNACGTNIIVEDKSQLNIDEAIDTLNRWLNYEFGWDTFQLHYLDIKPRIICEEFIANSDGSEIEDYKFLCFDGEPRFIWATQDRHSHPVESTLDLSWNFAEWRDEAMPRASKLPDKPKSFELMIEFAKKLSAGFSHVRIDFYELEGRPLFGEMTFTSGSGLFKFYPDEWDYKLGEMWKLDTSSTN